MLRLHRATDLFGILDQAVDLLIHIIYFKLWT